MEISSELLSPETLDAVIESFILREGTDYGVNEVSLETKVAQVRRELAAGRARLLFDAETESLTIERTDQRSDQRTDQPPES